MAYTAPNWKMTLMNWENQLNKLYVIDKRQTALQVLFNQICYGVLCIPKYMKPILVQIIFLVCYSCMLRFLII
jgi:hypothetical protein